MVPDLKMPTDSPGTVGERQEIRQLPQSVATGTGNIINHANWTCVLEDDVLN